MKKILFPIVALIAGAFCVTSCKPTAYVPDKLNVPMMVKANDFTGDLGIGISGLNIQAAYSPANNFGLMANFNTEFVFSKEENKKYRKETFGEVGAGYYHTIGKHFMYDVYGGGGFGQSLIVLDSSNRSDETFVNFYRIFAQPSIGFASNIFKLNLACRLNYYSAFDTWGTSSAGYKANIFFCEPALTAKIGFKWIMVYFQYAMSLPLQTTDFDYYRENYGSVTAGLCLNLNFSKKKK